MARFYKINARTQAELLVLLTEGTRTMRELADDTGFHYLTIVEYVRELRRVKMVHVVMWVADARGRYVIAVYKLGKGVDVVKKNPKTRNERLRERWARDRDAALMGLKAPRRVATAQACA